MGDVDIGILWPATLPLLIMEVIIVVMLVGVGIGQKDQPFIGEMDIGLIPANLPNITHVTVVEFLLHQFILFI